MLLGHRLDAHNEHPQVAPGSFRPVETDPNRPFTSMKTGTSAGSSPGSPYQLILHNQKYYTWVEQHGKSVKELDELWYGDAFQSVHGQAAAIDELIEAFNDEVGILKNL